jgi:HK97 family phage prohead protease
VTFVPPAPYSLIGSIEGRACPYGVPSRPLVLPTGERFFEVLNAGCFSESLRSVSSVPVYIDFAHAEWIPLGNTVTGAVRFIDGPGGLDFVVELVSHPAVASVLELYRSGVVVGECSVQLRPVSVRWVTLSGVRYRYVDSAELTRVALVTRGAYPFTRSRASAVSPAAVCIPSTC